MPNKPKLPDVPSKRTVHMRVLLRTLTVIAWVAPVLTGCFYPMLQTASVRRGFHLTAGASVLSDQPRLVGGRSYKRQGSDYIVFVSPSYGFGQDLGVEFGVPIGLYGEDLTGKSEGRAWLGSYGWEVTEDDVAPLVFPYLKLAVPHNKRGKVAGVLGFGSIALIYSHKFNRWEPYVSIKKIFSGGDPQVEDVGRVLSRYQESNQRIWTVTLGAEWKAALAVELGILGNSYLSPFERPDRTRKTLYDVFVAAKFTR